MNKLTAFFDKAGNRLILFLILVVGLLAARSMFGSDYFIMHDDLQMMRQLTMEKCFRDGQIPCRWSPDMGYGFGYPLFNFYPPLPYLVGQIFRILGFAFMTTVKLTFAFSLILSGFTMYLLARRFFGKLGGFVSAVFYVWAPYRAVDVFVRGAMNEGWVFVFMPLILLFSYLLITEDVKQKFKNIVFLSLSYAALFLTHNLIVVIFTPFFVLWSLIWIIKKKQPKMILWLIVSGVWALGMAAFFTIPAFFENSLVHFENLASDYFEYFAHYVSLKQLLLSRFWGDGPSVFGTNDEMAFPVGHFHWILSLTVLIFSLIRIIKKRKIDTLGTVIIFSVLTGWFGAFMTHQRSSPIWFAIPYLKYVQFPWRFLTIVVLGLSLSAGGLVSLINNFSKDRNIFLKFTTRIFSLVLVIPLMIAVIIWNFGFFKPVRMGPTSDEERFSGEAWRIQQGAGIRDYLPLTADDDPDIQRKDLVDVMSGGVSIAGVKEGTYWALLEADSENEAVIRINTMFFPNWRVFYKEGSTSREIPVFIPDEENWGRIWINLPAGKHLVYLQLFNTPIRTYSNILSLISAAILIGLFLYSHLKTKCHF